MQDDSTTQQIEERLAESLLGNDTENDYAENNNSSVFRIDGGNNVDFSATAIMEAGGDIIVDGSEATRGGFGGPLPPEYRDAPFAVAFCLHQGIVVYFAMALVVSFFRGSENENRNLDETDDSDPTEGQNIYVLLRLALFACAISVGISALSLKVMMNHAETLIQVSVIGSCGFMAVLAVVFLWVGVVTYALLWAFSFLMTAWYAKLVWYRIPFASSNLRTALSAIQTNAGVCVLAYGMTGLAIIWMIVWFLAYVGVGFQTSGDGSFNPNVLMSLFLIFSFYWTIQVFQNVLHVTVSGVVGTWWFAPHDAMSVFSPAIVDSFRRATTYSFGSICMGSLLVAIIQTLEAWVVQVSRNDRSGVLSCIAQCILRLLVRIAAYINRWAYCYVGLYGFDFISSGKKAMELFQAKGWTTIITDQLVSRSLRLVAVVVGALSGLVCMLLGKVTGWTTPAVGMYSDVFVFFLCSVIGFAMASILMNVVLSAVDTVIVAFAEAPAEFQTHHPALSSNMVQKWKLVFPEECGF